MISVIIPYNKDRGYLQQAIDSVQAQTYRDFELIVCQSEGLAGFNFNQGVEKSKGDFICYLCEDDLLPDDSLQVRLDAMEDYDFIHAKGLIFETKEIFSPYPLTNPDAELSSMLIQNGIMGGTMLYRREIFDEFQIDEKLWTAEEYDFNLKLLYHGKRLGFCDEITYLYRHHSEQKSIGNRSTEYQSKRREQVEMIRNRYR